MSNISDSHDSCGVLPYLPKIICVYNVNEIKSQNIAQGDIVAVIPRDYVYQFGDKVGDSYILHFENSNGETTIASIPIKSGAYQIEK